MFNLFKRKQHLLPSDVKNGMLTSNFATFKVGEKLDLLENLVCYIRYKDKTYKELTSGSYALNKEFLLDLYTKQLKRKDKIKTLKADLYFVNLNAFKYEFEYVDTIILNGAKSKVLFNVNVSLQVEDSKTFTQLLIYENTAPTAETTKNLLIDFAEECIRKYFLKKKLETINLSLDMQQELSVTLTKYFKKLGVSVVESKVILFKKTTKTSKEDSSKNSISVSNSTPNNNAEVANEDNIREKKENLTHNSVDQTENLIYNKNANTNLCPQCQCKMIAGSLFCHICGYRK